MKVGLAPLPAPESAPRMTVEELYAKLLPSATREARRRRLTDPDYAAADAVTKVLVDKHYQDRWQPGSGTMDSYLWVMVRNRISDIALSQRRADRRRHWERETPDVYDGHHSSRVDTPVWDVAYEDVFQEVEDAALFGQLRDRVAEVEQTSVLPLATFFDDLATAALMGDDVGGRALGRRMDTSPQTARKRRAVLAELAQEVLADA